MCGRYDLTESPQMLMLYFLLAVEPDAFGNADVRPTNTAPIIRVHEGMRVATMARWGLIPSWSKDDKIAQHTFNDRGETIADKPSFRAAFKRRRCIVPASAFFEWKAVIGEKKCRGYDSTGATVIPWHWQAYGNVGNAPRRTK